MGLISRRQMALNSALVIAGLIIGVGVIMGVQANAIDLDNCEGNFANLYPDADSDGYGDASADPIEGCSGVGYVNNNLDCNDGDGEINPDAGEVCDRIDNNCDGETNEGIATSTYYRDRDGDGHGGASTTVSWCEMPNGYAAAGDDCDDADVLIYPGAPEICDFIDNNCDGSTDEGLRMRIYFDWDEDGFGDPDKATSSCAVRSDYVSDNTDCNDDNADVNPNAAEVCDDDIDNDCDGLSDEGCGEETAWYRDADGDSYGGEDDSVTADEQPSGYVSGNEDCDDGDGAIHPGAAEICDFIDNDCDGAVDEGLRHRYYYDYDLDAYGGAGTATSSCEAPDGYISDNTDCDDEDADVNPGVDEECGDGIDNNCDGTIDEDCDDDGDDCSCDRGCGWKDWDEDDFGCGGKLFKNHGQYASCWAHWTNWMKKLGNIDGWDDWNKGKSMSEKAKHKYDNKKLDDHEDEGENHDDEDDEDEDDDHGPNKNKKKKHD